MTVIGISDPYPTDDLDDFVATHDITFTTLADTPNLEVTSHYRIRFWSQYHILDRHGNRVGAEPAHFDTATARQTISELTTEDRSTTPPWDLTYLRTT